jgi:hypothetical protein
MKALKIIGAIIVGIYLYVVLAYPSVTVRYRLTLVVEADGKEHVGSGVLEVKYATISTLLRNHGGDVGTSYRGEAVAVNIPNRGTLFALMKASSDTSPEGSRSRPPELLLMAFGFPYGHFGRASRENFNRVKDLSGEREIKLNALPMLVRFRNIDDPSSVEQVDPRDLSAGFGPKAYIKRAFIAITKDPLTTGIDQRLPWLDDLRKRNSNLRGDTSVARSLDTLASRLGAGAFQLR